MSDAESDLRATADDILADVKQLEQLEAEKQDLGRDDPRRVELAAKAETVARRMVPKTVAERELAQEAASEESEGSEGSEGSAASGPSGGSDG
ncbi:MAG TPA: hypothetical protein VM344_08525 [Vitreimonas sp.]|nr:hypothetical protein [Vitreimonas sp.]